MTEDAYESLRPYVGQSGVSRYTGPLGPRTIEVLADASKQGRLGRRDHLADKTLRFATPDAFFAYLESARR